ncbi:MAG: minor capsid protein [Firmicutes bacterium]|nr:minor capsid protein [Bacillota bacterium]
MTKEAYFSSLAQKECFEDLDVEEYEIVATLDNRTSELCQEMDGQRFPMKDFEAGVTAPPFHVNCRSTTCPYFNDEFSVGERAARDENGEVYYVPSDMTYPKWKEAFVDGGSKENLVMLDDYAEPPEPDVTVEKKTIEYDTKKPFMVEEWEEVENSTGTVTELSEYTVNGVTYKVDGKNIKMEPSKHEGEIADVLAEKYNKNVEFVPRITNPQHLKTSDYLIDGSRVDLKTIHGEGKDVIRDAIKKKKSQSRRFILDVSDSTLSEMEVERQTENVFYAPNTKFVEKLIIIRDKKVIKVYTKK